MSKPLINIQGKKYNMLTPLEYVKGGNWLCKCDCGNTTILNTYQIRKSIVKSCGCLLHVPKKVTHGLTGTPEYEAYKNAKKRCTGKYRKDYKDYGGRGIEFRLESVVDIVESIGFRPSSNHTLDRIDNEGHYEKGNLRWATMKEQCANRRQRSC